MNTTNKNHVGCANFALTASAKELTQQFILTKKQTRRYNGENDEIDGFAYSALLLTANKDSFDWPKFLSLTRAFVDSPEGIHTLQNLFSDWVNHLIQRGRLTRELLIDLPIYRFV